MCISFSYPDPAQPGPKKKNNYEFCVSSKVAKNAKKIKLYRFATLSI